MANATFRLLAKFRDTFEGNVYRHRVSTLGNTIGRELFEDLLVHNVSLLFTEHVRQGLVVVDVAGKVQNRRMFRRNDSVLGRLPAGQTPHALRSGFSIAGGLIAEPRVGCEVKIIAKEPLKQIDRVISDLLNFSNRVKRVSPKSVSVAIVGVNHEGDYVSYEGDKTYKHPLRSGEPGEAIHRIESQVSDTYDELLIFPFRASNQPPYPFAWVQVGRIEVAYGSVLTRIGELYQQRFS